MRETLERQAGVITPDELGVVVDRLEWPLATSSPAPPVVVSGPDEVFAQAALDNPELMVTGGADVVMKMHPLAWSRTWTRWLTFIVQSHEHGGIRVT